MGKARTAAAETDSVGRHLLANASEARLASNAVERENSVERLGPLRCDFGGNDLSVLAQPIRRPVLRYYGGKYRLAPRLIQLFPVHHIYTEAFGGAASVLMLKPRSPAEIYNDLDGEVVNVFRVLQVQSRAHKLEQLLRVTPFSRTEFEKSYKPSADPVERARRTIMRSFMGFGSDSITRVKASATGFNTRVSTMKTGFRSNSWRSNTPAAVDWARYPDTLQAFCDRMRGVVIENRNALEVIAKADREDTLHYVDPPYPKSTRNNGATESRVEHNYRHEMSDEDHIRLAELLHNLKGMVMISSYPGPLYEKLYADWKAIEWIGNQFCHGSQKRTETVWINAAAYAGMSQKRFEMETA
jgi:DNA adenine methylase